MVPSPLLEWLLEPGAAHAGVRFFTLRDILGLPENDGQLTSARQELMASGPVAAILARQQLDGSWEENRQPPYNKYHGSHWQLHFLGCLGADPADERIQRAGWYALERFTATSGGFAYNKPPAPSGAIHCLNGNLVDALIQLGFASDPRLQAAANWIAQAVTGEGDFRYYKTATSGPGFACAANQGQPCGWGAVKALRALTSLPGEYHTPAVKRALAVGGEFLLSRNPARADYPFTERVSSTWFKLGFPLSYWADVLELVDVLARMGFGHDPRLDDAWELILKKRSSDGRWTTENCLNGKMWVDLDPKGQPGKWVTLRALRALQRAGRLQEVSAV